MHLHILHNTHHKSSLNLNNRHIINTNSVPTSLCFFVWGYVIKCLVLQPFLWSFHLFHFLYLPVNGEILSKMHMNIHLQCNCCLIFTKSRKYHQICH